MAASRDAKATAAAAVGDGVVGADGGAAVAVTPAAVRLPATNEAVTAAAAAAAVIKAPVPMAAVAVAVAVVSAVAVAAAEAVDAAAHAPEVNGVRAWTTD